MTESIQESITAKSPSRISKRGFASMSIEDRRRIASMGGKAVHPSKRSFSRSRKLASEAGKRGGVSVPPEKRSYFKDRELASRCGRIGGMSIPAEKRSFSTTPGLASKAGKKGGVAPRRTI
jgi:general stress protein YciG